VSVIVAAPGQPLSGQAAQTVQIAAHSSATLVIQPKKGQGSATALVVVVTPLPGSGPVYAARFSEVSSTLDQILPLISTPTSVPLPPVSQSVAEIWK